jgi:hypothetical protein
MPFALTTLALIQWTPVPLLIFLTRWIDSPLKPEPAASRLVLFGITLLGWMLMVSASILAIVLPLAARVVGFVGLVVLRSPQIIWQLIREPRVIVVVLWCLLLGGLLYWCVLSRL